MHGEPLPREHGYPVRPIVPGWYGVNNVKWVEERRVTDSMVVDGSLERPGEHAFWQQASCRIHPAGVEPGPAATIDTVDTRERLDGAVEYQYAFDATVTSVIGKPAGVVPVTPRPDDTIEVRGVAWSGDDAVHHVEVSTDGGRNGMGQNASAPSAPVPGSCSGTTGRPNQGRTC